MCVVDTQEGSLALDHSTVRCSPGPRLLQEEDPDPGMVGTWESSHTLLPGLRSWALAGMSSVAEQ